MNMFSWSSCYVDQPVMKCLAQLYCKRIVARIILPLWTNCFSPLRLLFLNSISGLLESIWKKVNAADNYGWCGAGPEYSASDPLVGSGEEPVVPDPTAISAPSDGIDFDSQSTTVPEEKCGKGFRGNGTVVMVADAHLLDIVERALRIAEKIEVEPNKPLVPNTACNLMTCQILHDTYIYKLHVLFYSTA